MGFQIGIRPAFSVVRDHSRLRLDGNVNSGRANVVYW